MAITREELFKYVEPKKPESAYKHYCAELLCYYEPVFIEIDGGIFLVIGLLGKNYAGFCSLREKMRSGNKEWAKHAQTLLNHVHFCFFTDNLKKKRELGKTIYDVWKKALIKQFPEFKIHLELIDNEGDIILNLWAEKK